MPYALRWHFHSALAETIQADGYRRYAAGTPEMVRSLQCVSRPASAQLTYRRYNTEINGERGRPKSLA